MNGGCEINIMEAGTTGTNGVPVAITCSFKAFAVGIILLMSPFLHFFLFGLYMQIIEAFIGKAMGWVGFVF